ncbi:MAG: tetratricopeptide repeat protein [Bacteroidota bacterium]
MNSLRYFILFSIILFSCDSIDTGKEVYYNARKPIRDILFSETEKALIQSEQLINLAFDTETHADAYFMRGYCHYLLKNYSKALTDYSVSMELFRKIGSKKREADLLKNIGWIYNHMGKHAQAIQLYEDAFDLFLALEDREQVGQIMYNIGVAYYDGSDYMEATEHIVRSIEIAKEVKDTTYLSWNYNYLGQAYQKIDEHMEAIEQFEKAKKNLLSRDHSLSDLADVIFNTGLSKDELFLHIEALSDYESAKILYLRDENRERVAWTDAKIALSLAKRDRLTQATPIIASLIKQSGELSFSKSLFKYINELSLICEQEKDFEMQSKLYKMLLPMTEQHISLQNELEYQFRNFKKSDVDDLLIAMANKDKETIEVAEWSLWFGFVVIVLLSLGSLQYLWSRYKMSRARKISEGLF